VQRPDLFRAVSCIMPILDMLRYQMFDFGSIWTEEFGSSDNPEQFGYLYKYSPYHNVVDGTDYPAILMVASGNDNRCDPLHVRKMAARMQAANPKGKPIHLLVWEATGHVGSATITENIERYADEYSFLMDELGMQYPTK
jgi:prolyl oligopeptidase